MAHVVLLGDSVFDNGVYVPGQPDVARQLQARLPEGARASLRAVDGAVIASVEAQLHRLPADATHLVLSVGGNDALRESGIVGERAGSVAEALNRIEAVAERFSGAYGTLLDRIGARGLPLAVCTIYDPRYPDPATRRLTRAALRHLNDAILRHAFARGLPVLDLRLICGRDEDFANPIEPSAKGGDKIAAAVVRLLAEAPFGAVRSTVYAGTDPSRR
jgi:hypothetical protein